MKNISLIYALILGLTLVCISCEDDSCPDGDFVDINGDCIQTRSGIYAKILADINNKVILKTYTEFSGVSEFMNSSILTFLSTPNDENLNIVREAWLSNRGFWERSEGFLFGPAITDGLASSIDTWPVIPGEINSVLNGNDAINKDFLESQPGSLKGFHTLEFLLWGEDGLKTADDFTARELDYVLSCMEVLSSDANKLLMAWSPSGGDFSNNVINAGVTGSIYSSQKAALLELTNSILWLTDDVSNRKMNIPLIQEDVSLAESQFSLNSKADFINNMRSIENIYIGVNGDAITDLVSDINPAADLKIRTSLENAINALEAIPDTFSDAIPLSSPTRASAELARSSVQSLKEEIEGTLLPIISGL